MQTKQYNGFLILLFILSFSFSIFGQQSLNETNLFSEFKNAKALFSQKSYGAAKDKFTELNTKLDDLSTLKIDVAFYEALSTLKLNETFAEEKLVLFLKKYPNNNKKHEAYFNLGTYFFNNENPELALKWYAKVNSEAIPIQNAKELNFKIAYSYLNNNNLNEAKSKFESLLNDKTYGKEANYYYGYINYKEGNLEEANEIFEIVALNKTYKGNVSYYLLDINFQQKKFEKAIAIGKRLLNDTDENNESDISKIIGESLFNLKRYREAIPYLKAYENANNSWNTVDYYQLGFAYFKQKDYKNAINNFNKIVGANDKIAQKAYYTLGECYLKIGKKIEALNAFKSASEMNFNSVIEEDAALNYAKLSYEEGNPFYPVANVLQDYLKKYPRSKSYNLIKDLLVTSYIYQQDYNGALQFLSINKSKENISKSYEISLYRGIQLFNNNQLTSALRYFSKATKSSNQEISLRGLFWKAETNYQLKKFQIALNGFLDFNRKSSSLNIEEKNRIDYTIAYSYFKQNNYQKAASYFNRFLKNKNANTQEKNDALVRLADCQFVTKNYQEAITTYQKIINSTIFGADYAQYQKAMCYGFLGDNNKKISALRTVKISFSNSILNDDALFELGNTHSILKETTKAINAFNQLLTDYPKSIFVPKVLIRKGLLYYNNSQNEAALSNYKKVVSNYPNTSEAFQAVANARNVYIDDDNIDEYLDWIEKLKFINLENAEIDNTRFASAEKVYLSNTNNQQKISSLEKYLTSFPEGIHSLKANFYVAESYYKISDFSNAKKAFQKVIKNGQNDYSETSLLKLSQILLEEEKYSAAIPFLKRIEQEAISPENIVFAKSNLMQSYYQTKSYELAISYAKLLVKKENINTTVFNDANAIIAKSAIAKNDFTTAKKYYTIVEKNAEGALKAEALYYNAFFKNKANSFEASNKIILKIIADYSSYKYWGVKSYLIMAKNYAGLDDVYQATFVLENIIKNFTQFEDVITEAKKELAKIKQTKTSKN